MRLQHGLNRRWAWGVLASCVTAFLTMLLSGPAQALTQAQALAIVQGDNDARVEALNNALLTGDTALPALVKALLNDEVKLSGQAPEHRVVILRSDNTAVDAATQASVKITGATDDVSINNRLRREYQDALAALNLLSPDAALRQQAAAQIKDGVDASKLPLIERALSAETDAALKIELQALKARASMASPDKQTRIDAARSLAQSADPATRALLMERTAQETDGEVKSVLATSLNAVNQRLLWGERFGMLFTGISLGSILLLAALGLAITYGLMGVINMAHGELMMVGAYATYLVQNLFRTHWPAAFDTYLLLAIPAAFLTAAAVGAVMERTVIRWLYGRPLETLLATWGISLMLMQTVRSLFGAQNVPVENPAWLSGGLQVLPNLTLPYNRLALIAFVAAVLLGVTLLMSRTRLGLFVRGVTQNLAWG
jgi:urea transport system permease protein